MPSNCLLASSSPEDRVCWSPRGHCPERTEADSASPQDPRSSGWGGHHAGHCIDDKAGRGRSETHSACSGLDRQGPAGSGWRRRTWGPGGQGSGEQRRRGHGQVRSRRGLPPALVEVRPQPPTETAPGPTLLMVAPEGMPGPGGSRSWGRSLAVSGHGVSSGLSVCDSRDTGGAQGSLSGKAGSSVACLRRSPQRQASSPPWGEDRDVASEPPRSPVPLDTEHRRCPASEVPLPSPAGKATSWSGPVAAGSQKPGARGDHVTALSSLSGRL